MFIHRFTVAHLTTNHIRSLFDQVGHTEVWTQLSSDQVHTTNRVREKRSVPLKGQVNRLTDFDM